MKMIKAKTIVTNNKNGFWFGTKFTMNIYRGCSHGCIYCDSRSECYHNDNFDEVVSKENALRIIRDDLRRKKFKGVICTGAMSDPYNPFEEKEKLTRNALELVNAYGFGIAVATKSDLITRDIELYKDISTHSPVLVMMTITTIDDACSKIIEPSVCLSSKRFEALKKLSDAGIQTCILLMPVLPWITDSEENLLGIVRKAHECGVKYIYTSMGMTLRDCQRDYYYQKLELYFPGLQAKYVEKYKECYSCGIPAAKSKFTLVEAECRKLGILTDIKAIIKDYQGPYMKSQLSLFDEFSRN